MNLTLRVVCIITATAYLGNAQRSGIYFERRRKPINTLYLSRVSKNAFF